ncbi:MarR family winged helix-turn-helix transcriptional regulator [Clostridium grantii]|uniref:DNA-binding transcriptional regulator, MarR family n=1 Tax=Clostridium grantii DSM 8605 TaxID=1121316 RepID=A0A1M5VZD6_9CLOT|nr:MarR family transcriptional regulator [Clostridium grantii]SHH80615.1 DNA-binding transcriptional regulator, MarR family [Clostridium grantii DSM 8605]
MNKKEKPGELYHFFLSVCKLAFNKTHVELEKIGLYRGQPPVLFLLWEKDGRSRKELCDNIDIQPATITKMIKRLENTDFVLSKPDDNDLRVSRVYLTEKGKNIKNEVEKIYFKLEEQLLKDFSVEDKLLLNKLLISMKINLKNI